MVWLKTILDCIEEGGVLSDITSYDNILQKVKEEGIVYKAQLLTLKDLLNEDKHIGIDKSYGDVNHNVKVEIDEYIPVNFVPNMPFSVYDEGIVTNIYFEGDLKDLKENTELLMYGMTMNGTAPYISAIEFWHLREIWNSKDHTERFV